jgi:hypothetical protein
MSDRCCSNGLEPQGRQPTQTGQESQRFWQIKQARAAGVAGVLLLAGLLAWPSTWAPCWLAARPSFRRVCGPWCEESSESEPS